MEKEKKVKKKMQLLPSLLILPSTKHFVKARENQREITLLIQNNCCKNSFP